MFNVTPRPSENGPVPDPAKRNKKRARPGRPHTTKILPSKVDKEMVYKGTENKAAASLKRARIGVKAIREGRMVVVMDDLDRENEGDVICAAENITAEQVSFMVRHSGGILCAPATPDRLHELGMYSMVRNNRDPNNTAFTVSVDYRVGTTTGISASDRAKTFRALADPTAKKENFTAPGHVFPLIYTPGGVLRRKGHTEASVDLCRLAGLTPVAVISELVRDDGEPKRLTECKRFCEEFDIALLCVEDIENYIRHLYSLKDVPLPELEDEIMAAKENFHALATHIRGHDTQCVSTTTITLNRGKVTLEDAQLKVFRSLRTGEEHPVVVVGDPKGEDVLVRVHSECLTGDILGSTRCDCGAQLTMAYQRIAEKGAGIVIYVKGHEGRGISLSEKIKAYALQDEGYDTYEANQYLGFMDDERKYGMVAEILDQLNIRSIRLLTNNPTKAGAVKAFKGVKVRTSGLRTEPTKDNLKYLLAKQRKGGHRLKLEDMGDGALSTCSISEDCLSDGSLN